MSLPESTLTSAGVDTRRILIFCVLAFAVSGSAAAYLVLTGGIAGGGMRTLAVVTLWYMPGPALAHLLTRLLTREGWQDMGLRPRLRQNWPAWLVAWFLPGILAVVGAGIYFLIFPRHFDPDLNLLAEQMAQAEAATGEAIPLSPTLLLVVQLVQALLLAPLLNALPTFGEEFGWRAYLQPKLLPLGWRRAMLLMGVIWGAWHWPILALGYNYGLEYPGAPWLGMLVFLWFTFSVGTILGWLTLKGRSVWPAVIGHGALNGMAGFAVFLTQGEPNPLLGPLPIGLIGGLGYALVAGWLFLNPPK